MFALHVFEELGGMKPVMLQQWLLKYATNGIDSFYSNNEI